MKIEALILILLIFHTGLAAGDTHTNLALVDELPSLPEPLQKVTNTSEDLNFLGYFSRKKEASF